MKGDRLVAGLWCHDVLAKMSEYLDAELDPADREQVEAHLRGCDACARFGGELATTVRSLRAHLLTESLKPVTLRERLREAIDSEDR